MTSKGEKTITMEQMQMLANIFRIIAKEIRYDEDKEKLAPGEIGISYTEGCFYVRDPNTGELFCPNSVAHINQILAKYDPKTGKLNSDYINGIKVYSSISQLTQLGVTLSIDTIIRQMEYPGILMSSVEYDKYADYGFPSSSGMLLVYKIAPEFVMCSYYDNQTFTNYDGRYDSKRMFFEGWAIGGSGDTTYVTTSGGGTSTSIEADGDLEDLMCLTVRVTETLEPGAKLSYNGGTYLPIIDKNGDPLASSILANNIIMLIYDKAKNGWIWLNSTESSINVVLETTSERVRSLSAELDLVKKDYVEKINNLTTYVNEAIAAAAKKPGLIQTVTSTFISPMASTSEVNKVDGFDPKYDKLVVNYNQTILRAGIDYIVDANTGGIQLNSIKLDKGEVLQFIVIKQTAVSEP